MLGKEIQALSDLKKQEKRSGLVYPYDYVPRCVTKGMFLLEASPASDEEAEEPVNQSILANVS